MRAGRLHDLGHGAQLDPGTGVQHHQELPICQLTDLDVAAQRENLAVGIEECQVGRRGLGIDHEHIFAQGAEDPGHTQLAAQGIAVGTNVARQQKPFMAADQMHQGGPVNCHRVPSVLWRSSDTWAPAS